MPLVSKSSLASEIHTYKWNSDTLELINTRKGKFFGE